MFKVDFGKCIIVILILFIYCNITTVRAQQINTDSINAILHSTGDKEKVTFLYNLSKNLSNNNPNLAIDYINQAIESALKTYDADALAKCYQLLAGIHFRFGAFPKAKEYFLQSLNYYTQTKNEKGKAEVNNSIASINFAQGNFPAAVEGYLNSLKFYEDINDRQGMLSTLNNLGSVYTKQNNFSKAIEYNLRAIKLYEESADRLRTVVGYDNIGNIFLRQGNLLKAKEYFNKSLKIYSESNNNTGTAYTLNQLGNIEAKLDKDQNAVTLFLKSLSICEKLNTQPLIVKNLNDLASSYSNLGDYVKAIETYKRSISIAKRLNYLIIELDEAYKGLSDIYKITNQIGKATTFSILSNQIQDSLFNDSIVKRLSDISLRYESEKKQSQIEILSKERAIKESELLREKQISTIFIISSIILFIIFIVLIYFFIQNKHITRNLKKQKSELEAKNKAILEQSEKLNQLNTVKDRFFSIISHDLRNNLTTMKLYFDLISHPEYTDYDNKEVTKNISTSVENTIDLLENLLIWASAQIKGVPIHIQKINLHSLALENLNLLHNAAIQKHINLTNNIGENITAYGDMDMIRLVIRNLIANAIKFTGDYGSIVISATLENDMCNICISDNGVGISKSSLDKLFIQNLNPTTKGTANEKGTGLGLILCKDFIERNKGRIWVESEEGKGSKFCFELPVQA